MTPMDWLQVRTGTIQVDYRYLPAHLQLAAWRSGKRSSSMNEVNARRARLQLGLVTVFERVYHLGL